MKLYESSQLPIQKNISEIKNAFDPKNGPEAPLLHRGEKSGYPGKSEGIRLNNDQRHISDVEKNHSEFERVAKTFRVADRTMKDVDKIIGKMKDQLSGIVKHYPPFPTDSIERIKALKNFSTLRKEIDRLSIPPDDDGAAKLMADPDTITHAGKWDIYFNSGKNKHSVEGKPIHTGPHGLDIPEIPANATDETLQKTMDGLEEAKTKLFSTIKALHRDLENIKTSII